MTFYEDLSEYTYMPMPSGSPAMKNVGWLEKGVPFRVWQKPSSSDCPPLVKAVLDALNDMKTDENSRCRGMHNCEFCEETKNAKNPAFGCGEYRIQGANGVVYSAPSLIVHYMGVHKYLPPEEFMSAVLFAAAQKKAEKSVDNVRGGKCPRQNLPASLP